MKKLKYSRLSTISKNEPVSAGIHAAGLLFAIVGFGFLMRDSFELGSLYHLIGFAVFGISLILLFSVSAVYHFFPRTSPMKKKLQRMDHIMIYLFMAATYTPICLAIDNRSCGWGLLGVAWALALTGIIIKGIGFKIKEWASTLMYIAFGLLILSAVYPLTCWLPKDGLGFLFGGGSLYLIGVVFYILEDYGPRYISRGFHAIWHLFVIGGVLVTLG